VKIVVRSGPVFLADSPWGRQGPQTVANTERKCRQGVSNLQTLRPKLLSFSTPLLPPHNANPIKGRGKLLAPPSQSTNGNSAFTKNSQTGPTPSGTYTLLGTLHHAAFPSVRGRHVSRRLRSPWLVSFPHPQIWHLATTTDVYTKHARGSALRR